MGFIKKFLNQYEPKHIKDSLDISASVSKMNEQNDKSKPIAKNKNWVDRYNEKHGGKK